VELVETKFLHDGGVQRFMGMEEGLNMGLFVVSRRMMNGRRFVRLWWEEKRTSVTETMTEDAMKEDVFRAS
jgi:hypothetical protein